MSRTIQKRCCICWKAGNKSVSARYIAGRYAGGDEDVPAEWVPICAKHAKNWWEDGDERVPLNKRLPMFRINGGFTSLPIELI